MLGKIGRLNDEANSRPMKSNAVDGSVSNARGRASRLRVTAEVEIPLGAVKPLLTLTVVPAGIVFPGNPSDGEIPPTAGTLTVDGSGPPTTAVTDFVCDCGELDVGVAVGVGMVVGRADAVGVGPAMGLEPPPLPPHCASAIAVIARKTAVVGRKRTKASL
jgi:hypothetical protein